MTELVKKKIKKYSMINKGERIIVALSGGKDSMALLDILKKLENELEISVSCAHFNHCIRGEESDRDEAFVKKYCKDNKIELFCKRGNVLEYAKKKHIGTELAARELRYDFLSSLDCDKIATAHTAGDNAETMLFNLARGASLKGLCGIPPVRDKFIRPIIFLKSSETEDYCKKNSVPFVTDSTNLSDDYTRNYIRHNIIPKFKKINPSFESAALRAAESLREDEDFISEIAKSEFKKRFKKNELDVSEFDKLNIAVKKRIVYEFVYKTTGIKPDSLHISELLTVCKTGGRRTVAKNAEYVSNGKNLRLLSEVKPEFATEIKSETHEFLKNNKKVNNLLLNTAVDCDKIVGELRVRTRISGDKIRLRGRNCTKSLKKLFNECCVPVEERDFLPVVCDDMGPVFISGIGVAERCALSESTENVKIFSVSRIK